MKSFMLLFLCFLPQAAMAHVKWFSNYNFQQAPLQLSELNNIYFWGLFILSLVSLPALVYLDRLAEKSTSYYKINSFLDRYSANAPLIMRVTMGAVLLMSWQANSIIAPEIAAPNNLWVWFEFTLILFLFFKETTFLTGIGIITLYFVGMSEHGVFHMLDYVVYPAVGLYLILSNLKTEKFRNMDLPVIYSGLGFSLCWVAFEKLIYPFWGLSVLNQAPALTMGLDHQFFLMSCAFVEFTLGYLLIICLLHRPLAIVITLVFFITSSFFGKTEIVGHTILHGALLVFIVKGPGNYYQAPIRFHRSPWMRSLFAGFNFIILFAAMAFPYEELAKEAHSKAMSKQASLAHPRFQVPEGKPVPTVMVHATRDSMSGWNIHLMTSNFTFTPENAGEEDVMNEGHAHIFLNGAKLARVYGNWIHLNLPKGENKIRVNLTTNSHKDYYSGDKAAEGQLIINEDREVSVQGHAH